MSAQYVTLGPVAYLDGGLVREVVKAGVIITLDATQAAALAGSVSYFGPGTPFVDQPRLTTLGYDNFALFPVTGNEQTLYLDRASDILYRWSDGSVVYIAIADPPAIGASEHNSRPNLVPDGCYARDAAYWAAEIAPIKPTFQLSTTQSYLGSQSLQATGPGIHYPNVTAAGKGGGDATYGVIQSSAGRVYRLSFWVYRNGGNSTAGFVRGLLNLTGSVGGVDVLGGSVINQSSWTSGQWTYYQWKFVVPTTGTSAPYKGAYPSITFQSVGVGDVFYLDDVRFDDLSDAPIALLAPPPTGNRTTDTANVQALVDLAQTTNGSVILREGTYAMDIVTSRVLAQPTITGMGKQITLWDGTLRLLGVAPGGSQFSGAWLSGLSFTGSHAGQAAIELNGVVDVHWDQIRIQGTYDVGVWFRNELSGHFTEVCNGRMDFATTVITALKYTVNSGGASFHWSGLTGGTIQHSTSGPAILIEAGARPYNAPLTVGVWSTSSANPVIQHNGQGLANFFGNLTVEQTAVAPLCAGTVLPLVGAVNAYMSAGLTVDYGTLYRATSGYQAVSGQSVGAEMPIAASTATAAGTTTLTVASPRVQVFTGSTTQNCDLPTTSVIVGTPFTVINQSSGTVTVRSSAGNTIATLAANRAVVLIANTATPTTAAHWTPSGYATTTASVLFGTDSSGFVSQYAVTAATTVSTVVQRNANGSIFAINFVPNLTSTVTAAGTTALSAFSSEIQAFTGSTTQTVTLPTTGVSAGQRFTIINTSSGAVTVNSSGGNLVKTVNGSTSTVVTALIATPTTAANWFAS